MIYVYRRVHSTGARELAEALGGRRWRGTTVPIQEKVRRGDTVICWGEQLGPIPGVRIINGGAIRNKMQDALTLKAAGVATIEVAQTQPRVTRQAAPADPAVAVFNEAKELAEEFVETTFTRTPVLATGVGELHTALGRLINSLRTPAPVAPPPQANGEWVGRSFNHVGGNDLLRPGTATDYFVKKENFVKEFRVHSFGGKSIRAGIKAAREGVAQHAWVRSWDGGWRILYDGVSSKKAHRELAHKAVAALGLEFGAVDIGQRADNSLVVLEVNRAPGLEGGTVGVYADAVRRLIGA